IAEQPCLLPLPGRLDLMRLAQLVRYGVPFQLFFQQVGQCGCGSHRASFFSWYVPADLSMGRLYLGELLTFRQPTVDKRADPLWMGVGEVCCGLLNQWQKVGVTHQVGHPELHQTGLTGTQYLAGTAQLEILFGNDKTV